MNIVRLHTGQSNETPNLIYKQTKQTKQKTLKLKRHSVFAYFVFGSKMVRSSVGMVAKSFRNAANDNAMTKQKGL